MEGIRDFWLREDTRHAPKELVLKALKLLCDRGVVHEEQQRQGIPGIYCSKTRGQSG